MNVPTGKELCVLPDNFKLSGMAKNVGTWALKGVDHDHIDSAIVARKNNSGRSLPLAAEQKLAEHDVEMCVSAHQAFFGNQTLNGAACECA